MNGRFFEEKYQSDAIGPSLRSSVKQLLKELGLDSLDKKQACIHSIQYLYSSQMIKRGLGPWWWSCGQLSRLLLWRSKFESYWLLLFVWKDQNKHKSPGLAHLQKSLIWKDKAHELLFFRGSSYIIDFKCDYWITVQDCPTQPSDTPHLGLGGLILILT